MWIFGGRDDDSSFNDIWCFEDGKNWQQVEENAPWSKRHWHTSVVFKNKMWILGGESEVTNNSDVWYSENGKEWFCATSSAGWNRSGHTSVVYDDKIWVIGGYSNGTLYPDSWYSEDGHSWIRVKENALWKERYFHSSFVHNSYIWLIGGQNLSGEIYNDIWNLKRKVSIQPKQVVPASTTKNITITSITPNPFSSHCIILFQTGKARGVKVRIYSSNGKLVYEDFLKHSLFNTYRFQWNGTDRKGISLPSGVYILQLESNSLQCREILIKNNN